MINTEELIQQCRDQVDEDAQDDLSDARILRALNRARIRLVRLAGRRMEQVFQDETTVTVETGTRYALMPESAFGLVIDQVTALQGGSSFQVTKAALRDMDDFESENASASIPAYYATQGNKVLFYPRPQPGVQLRIRYQARPPELVLTQGRITDFDDSATTVTLDSLGDSLTTDISALQAFVNLVDAATGKVKATLQVNSINTDTNVVGFKTTGLDRSVVFGRTVGTALPTDLTQDDYITIANGTCVPTLLQDYYDFLVAHAVLELKRSMSLPTTEEFAAYKALEQELKALWSGQANTIRVQRDNPYWGRRTPLLNRYR